MAKTTDIDPSADSYERQFAVIDKNLSEAFNDKTACERGRPDDAVLLSRNKYNFADDPKGSGTSDVIHGNDSEEDATGDVLLEGNATADMCKDSNNPAKQGDLDYIGYETNDNQGGMSSNNSESNLSESRSSSSSATPEPWGSLKPTESLGDFEKELLLIRDRYGANSNSQQSSGTVSEAVAAQHGDTNCDTKNSNQLNESLDPLSSLEQHFDNM